jgi:PAS domain-containing protein
MKITIKKLRKILGESAYYESMPREELELFILNADRDEIADKDYVSDEDGEIMWAEGQAAGETDYHHDATIRKEKKAADELERAQEEAEWEEEDRIYRERLAAEDAEEERREKSEHDFHVAAEQFAAGFENFVADFPDTNPSDAAADVVDNFMVMHPKWEIWAMDLGMDKEGMRAYLADTFYNVMSA